MTLAHPVATVPEADPVAPSPTRRDRTPLLALVPVVVGLAVTGYRVGGRQLWEDEYSTWHAAVMTLPQLRYLTSHLDFVIAPYYVFMHYWIRVFGDSPGALRAPSVVAMSLSAGLVTLIGRRLFGTAAGLVAGLLFLAVPGVSRYAQETRSYAIVMFFVLLATLLLLWAMDRPAWPRWLLYGLSMIAVCGSHIIALTVLSAHAIAVLRLALLDWSRAGRRRPRSALPAQRWRPPGIPAQRRRPPIPAQRRRPPIPAQGRRPPVILARYWGFAAAVALILAVTVPFAGKAHQESNALSWIVVTAQSLRAFPANLFGSATIACLVIALAMLGAVLLAWPARTRAGTPRPTAETVDATRALWPAGISSTAARRQALVLLGGWALVPAGLVLAASVELRSFYYRYLLFIIPAWVLLAACGLDGLVRAAVRRRPAWSVAATLVLTVAIGAVSVPDQMHFRHRLLPGSPDYSGVAAAIAARMRPGDGIAYGGLFYKGRRALTYEMRDWRTQPRDVFLVDGFAKTGMFVARECHIPAPCLHDTTRIWLVQTATTPGTFAELPAATAALLRSRFNVSAERDFYRARLYLLTLKPGENG